MAFSDIISKLLCYFIYFAFLLFIITKIFYVLVQCIAGKISCTAIEMKFITTLYSFSFQFSNISLHKSTREVISNMWNFYIPIECIDVSIKSLDFKVNFQVCCLIYVVLKSNLIVEIKYFRRHCRRSAHSHGCYK
jgi:hypothetical protein